MEFKRRDSYADLGLVIAIAIFLVMVIKTLLFGVTWGDIIWLLISIVYLLISFFLPSADKRMKYATTAFLLLCVATSATRYIYDQKATPKLHAFEGALNDTTSEEEFVVRDEPEIIKEQVIDTITIDTARIDDELNIDVDLDMPLEDTQVEDVNIDPISVEDDF